MACVNSLGGEGPPPSLVAACGRQSHGAVMASTWRGTQGCLAPPQDGGLDMETSCLQPLFLFNGPSVSNGPRGRPRRARLMGETHMGCFMTSGAGHLGAVYHTGLPF